ncbi:30S ribosomal protein S4e [Candidatus Woesearchaeota archaeon]|nr:30S ribosomal protein S4e [Candidatus Woesearchaeota archaeon]
MTKHHLKRINAPKTWPISKKENTFITRPHPGAHTLEEGLPLVVVLREILHLANTRKEVRYILNNRSVMVNGRRQKDPAFLVGVMDVFEILEVNGHFRMVFGKTGKLTLVPISKEEATKVIFRVEGKKFLTGGKVQLILRNGHTFLLPDMNTPFRVGDSVVLQLPERTIVDHLPFAKGALAYFLRGTYRGQTATLQEITQKSVTIKKGDELLQTAKAYALVVGKETPLVALA